MGLGFLGSAALGLLGGAASAYGAAEQRSWEAAQAEKQMQFQREMSGSIYQRGTEDMRKAGLNPILAAGNVSTPGAGGAMASSENVVGSGVSSALAAATGVKQLEVADAQAKAARAAASRSTQAALLDATRATNEARGEDNESYIVLQNRARLGLLRSQLGLTESSTALNWAQVPGQRWFSAHPLLGRTAPALIGGASGLIRSGMIPQ